MVLALELCATDLHSVITDIVGVIPPSVAKRLMRDLLRGLAAVHDAGARLRFPALCRRRVWRSAEALPEMREPGWTRVRRCDTPRHQAFEPDA